MKRKVETRLCFPDASYTWKKTKMETKIFEQQLHLKCNLSPLSPWKPTVQAEQDKDVS